jgi:hypothetical protein
MYESPPLFTNGSLFPSHKSLFIRILAAILLYT